MWPEPGSSQKRQITQWEVSFAEKRGQEPPKTRAGSHLATQRRAKICQMEQVLKVALYSH